MGQGVFPAPFSTVKDVYLIEKSRNFLSLDIWSRQNWRRWSTLHTPNVKVACIIFLKLYLWNVETPSDWVAAQVSN